tara:strand:+ start:22018 stop:22296 length:279 start_codon:yes stop_codon:yes gene_type:complete
MAAGRPRQYFDASASLVIARALRAFLRHGYASLPCPRRFSLSRLTALALREPRGGAHYTGGFMATLPTKALSKSELNSRNDKTASARTACVA